MSSLGAQPPCAFCHEAAHFEHGTDMRGAFEKYVARFNLSVTG